MTYHLGNRGLEAVQSFNAKKYFDSHYILEQLWVEAEGDRKRYLQGVIMIGAAAIKIRIQNNPASAERLLKKGCTLLKEIDNALVELDIIRLQSDAKHLLHKLESIGIAHIGDDDIPTFHLKGS